jgi:hypothetical protein
VLPESAVDAAGSSIGSAVLASTVSGEAAAPPTSYVVRRLPGASCDAVCLAAFRDSEGGEPVWRVDWNVTGTVLASSGDDGMVRLRRRTLAGVWECVSEVDATKSALGIEAASRAEAAPPSRLPGVPAAQQ